jgi:Zn finger protein HypA/HybF involved in hydrogenase expression
MKVEYTDSVQHRFALSRKMYCPFCGGHEYEIVEQLKPYTDLAWFIRCPQCGGETEQSPARSLVIKIWKQLKCG